MLFNNMNHLLIMTCTCTAVKIKKTLKNLNVVETQEAVFSLELTHENVRGAQWIKNGVEIQPSDKFEISMEGTVHTLKINNCSTQDESVYSFKLGKLSANARLNVESKYTIQFGFMFYKTGFFCKCEPSPSPQDPEETKGCNITAGCNSYV